MEQMILTLIAALLVTSAASIQENSTVTPVILIPGYVSLPLVTVDHLVSNAILISVILITLLLTSDKIRLH